MDDERERGDMARWCTSMVESVNFNFDMEEEGGESREMMSCHNRH